MISNSVYKYCKDDIRKIENFDKAINDRTVSWHCHHRLELTIDNEFANSAKSLIRMGMYYNRPYYELIFLPPDEHLDLHNKSKTGKHIEGTLLSIFRGNKHKFENMSSRDEVNDYIGYMANGDQNDIKRLRQYYTKYISKSKRKSLNYEERIKHMSPEEIDILKRKNSRFRVWYNKNHKNLIKKDIKNDRIQSRRSSILGIQNLGNLQLAMRKLGNIAR